MLASGIEAGHGERDYLIDVGSGNSKAITPEGMAGVQASRDGRYAAVLGPDGKWGVWPLNEAGAAASFRPIPGLDSNRRVVGWSPDGESVYVVSIHHAKRIQTIDKANIVSGKSEPWKTFGDGLAPGAVASPGTYLAGDNGSYVYLYDQMLSRVYVVRGMK